MLLPPEPIDRDYIPEWLSVLTETPVKTDNLEYRTKDIESMFSLTVVMA
ncbi:MAG: hypothetical protein IJW46_03505 [Clostridia bacterium]|nr:hypothetical protein [Clostridia bacterium]